MMERAGLEEVGFDESIFRPAEGASLEEIAAAFGQFVRERKIERKYALYAEYLGSHEGVTEVRAVLVDREGDTVWIDRQIPGAADFDRVGPKDPMGCCVLLAERLVQAMKLPEPSPGGDRQAGKLERQLTKESGIPEEAEFTAMEKRQELLAEDLADVTVVVYPVRRAGQLSRSQAERLAALLEEAGIGRAIVAPTELPIDVARAMNEQKVLWSLARSFQEHLRQHPPEADYALYADYLMGEPNGPVGAVHFVVCDREGDWVIVDFQNSHHEDFQAIAPGSADDCDRLAARRFASYVR
jgi:hypothetical protein